MSNVYVICNLQNRHYLCFTCDHSYQVDIPATSGKPPTLSKTLNDDVYSREKTA